MQLQRLRHPLDICTVHKVVLRDLKKSLLLVFKATRLLGNWKAVLLDDLLRALRARRKTRAAPRAELLGL